MKPESFSLPVAPTPAQLAEIQDAVVTAAEMRQVYSALLHHPRVVATPGSSDLFEACRAQVGQDMALLEAQAGDMQTLVLALPAEAEGMPSEGEQTLVPPPRTASLPDIEPPDPQKSVFVTVRKAFHLEDFLRQQLIISLHSAQERKHLKLELQLKMMILSTEQRCRLLEDRYGFARTGNVLFQGLRKQTTRFLSGLRGESRKDID